jgi:hypothetical protein
MANFKAKKILLSVLIFFNILELFFYFFELRLRQHIVSQAITGMPKKLRSFLVAACLIP